MENQAAAGFQVNQDDLRNLLDACKYAASQLTVTSTSLRLTGRNGLDLAQDAVSRDIATYYYEQVYQSAQSVDVVLATYRNDLFAAIDTLQNILVDYQETESAAAESMELS